MNFTLLDVLHGQLGLALEGQRRFKEAAAEFGTAARLNPGQPAYGELLKRADRESANRK